MPPTFVHLKGEPRYTRAEQRARMAQFDVWAEDARDGWKHGEAVCLIRFSEWQATEADAMHWRRQQARIAQDLAAGKAYGGRKC